MSRLIQLSLSLLIIITFPLSDLLAENSRPSFELSNVLKRHGRKFKVPLLKNSSDNSSFARVNSQIVDRTKDYACFANTSKEEFLLGLSPKTRPEDARAISFFRVDYDVVTRVEHISPKVFSIYMDLSYFCGSPYPTTNFPASVNFDLTSGELVRFADLFVDYQKQKKDILSAVFSKEVLLSKRKAFAANADIETCEAIYKSDSLVEFSYDYTVTDQGLYVQPELPHVSEVCRVRALVSYESLKNYLRHDGILAEFFN